MKTSEIFNEITDLGFVQDFLRAFPKGNIYLVGGCIRDGLLGIKSSDFDFVVENTGDEELINFLETEGKVVSVYGRTFGVVKFKPQPPLNLPLSKGEQVGVVYDIALPRVEMYIPGQRRKHAQVELENITISEDLARRDFTVNAMALGLRSIINSQLSISNNGNCKLENDKYVIDPYNGLHDLKNKIIRTVGDPRERLKEDPTRILRAVRFAVQFGFTIERQTFVAMKQLVPEIVKKYVLEDGSELQRVSWEMIGTEFSKSLQCDSVATLSLYDQIGLLHLLLPEIEATKGVMQPPQFHSEGDVFTHTMIALSKLPKDASFPVIFATLLHDIGKSKTFKSAEETGDRIRFSSHDEAGAEMARVVCRRFCFSNEITNRVVWMINNHIKVFNSFFQMRLEKQKSFVRNVYFDDLLVLAQADCLASIFPHGEPDTTTYSKILKIAGQIKAEDKNKPRLIINGREIISRIKEKNPDFDPKEHGLYVGDLKKRINTLYDRDEIKSKSEALRYLDEIIGKKHAEKREERKSGERDK